jgi:hypothetical protein
MIMEVKKKKKMEKVISSDVINLNIAVKKKKRPTSSVGLKMGAFDVKLLLILKR